MSRSTFFTTIWLLGIGIVGLNALALAWIWTQPAPGPHLAAQATALPR